MTPTGERAELRLASGVGAGPGATWQPPRELVARRRPGKAYALLMRTLYITTAGSSDATRASIPLHLAVNGSLEVGHDVGVVLAGDATELLKAGLRDGLQGIGVPPARDLLAKARQHNLPIYV